MSAEFVRALETEIAKLRETLERDIRFLRLRELERVRDLYAPPKDGEMPSLAEFGTKGERLRTKPPVRQASPERTRAIETARLYVTNRAGPVPTADIYEHLTGLGITIRGENPVNNLSAMLSNSGAFKANGRAGWTLRQPDDAETPDEDEDEEEEEEDQDSLERRALEQAERSVEILKEDLDDELPPPSSPRPPPPPPAERRAPSSRGGYDLDDDIPF